MTGTLQRANKKENKPIYPLSIGPWIIYNSNIISAGKDSNIQSNWMVSAHH